MVPGQEQDGAVTMPKKITLDAETFTVPLNKLTLSPLNVRRTCDPAEIEELAATIAKQGVLLQNLGTTEQLDDAGEPTGIWEVVYGGRRYQALTLLAERKRIAASAPIPCRKVERARAVEASLSENENRKALHPADQFEAFAALHEDGKGLGVEEIAARFGVTSHVVRQRLRLGAVSPMLLVAYRDGTLTLDQVMAFTVTDDRGAQERAYTELAVWQRTPHAIRRVLTQASVPAHDPRVLLVGLDTYQAAGGQVQRDLFSEDLGGWLTNAVLLERLVGERIEQEAEAVRAEGWKWVETDYAAAAVCWRNLRRVWPERVALSEADEKRRSEIAERWDELALEYPNDAEDAPEEVQAELEAIERELDAFEARERVYRPVDVACGGATITMTATGTLLVERGYIRPADEPQAAPEPEEEEIEGEADDDSDGIEDEEAAEQVVDGAVRATCVSSRLEATLTEIKAPALSAELDHELSARRTAALRVEIMRQPDLALRVLAHSLATATFFGGYLPTVARIAHPYTANYGIGGSGIADSPTRLAIKAAEDEQQARLPREHGELWAWLQDQDVPALHALLAVCIGRVADAQGGDWINENGARHVSAQAAQRAGLDMRQWWTATRGTYLDRVTKAMILDAVREGAGAAAARQIEDMKKDAMAENAEALLAGKGWLPARLRVPAAKAGPEATGDDGNGFEYPMAAE